MANTLPAAAHYSLGVNHVTLRTFTEESVTHFLTAVTNSMAESVIPRAGATPWRPTTGAPELRGTINVPHEDGGQPGTFNALTHPAVTRAILAADPANLRDQVAIMRTIAEGDNDLMRLAALRIAIRWNHAMRLNCENQLLLNEEAGELDTEDEQYPLAVTTVEDHDGTLVVVTHNPDGDNRVVEAGRPTTAAEPSPTDQTETGQTETYTTPPVAEDTEDTEDTGDEPDPTPETPDKQEETDDDGDQDDPFAHMYAPTTDNTATNDDDDDDVPVIGNLTR